MSSKQSASQIKSFAGTKLVLRTVALSQVKPAPHNPRVDLKPGDPEFEQLRRSLETFGVVEPIVWNKRTGHVVGGHQRLGVLKHLGHTKVEVVVVSLPLEQEKALNIALNKIQGHWDEGKLAALLQELGKMPDLDISLTGFNQDEIGDLLARVAEAAALSGNDADFNIDAALDTTKPAITKPGELLVLGHHRLLCGDCTNPDDVRQLMNNQRAVLFCTDPPYLVGYDGTNHPGGGAKHRKPRSTALPPTGGAASGSNRRNSLRPVRTTKNKDWSGTYGVTWDDADANSDLYLKFIGVAVEHAIAPNAAWYCWHASRRQGMVEAAWQKHGAFVHCQIIWTKNRPVLTRTWYAWKHEPCFFGWVQGKKPPRTSEPMLSTVWAIDTIPNGAERPDHPTPKPLEVFEIPMRQHTRPGDICYEPFAGSGTQIIAAERVGADRRCYAIEISPHYCDVIVRRWIHLVGAARAGKALVQRYGATNKPAAPSARKGAAA